MLEFIISSIISYFFGIQNGITIFILLKALFNKSYKLSLFWFINFFTYLFLGSSYIIFAKFYLIITGLVFFHQQFGLEEYFEKINVFKKLEKVKDIYNFINLLFSIPFYVLYDNVNYLVTNIGIKTTIQDNQYYKKYQENLQLVSDFQNMSDSKFNLPDMKFPEMPDIEKLADYPDEELEKMLDDMLNPNKFLNITNEMRKNIGKAPLNENDMINKISNFESLFEMFNTSPGLNNITNSLKDFDKEKLRYKK